MGEVAHHAAGEAVARACRIEGDVGREIELVAAGITEDMIRLSVGLEDIRDIQTDFESGFRAAKKIAGT